VAAVLVGVAGCGGDQAVTTTTTTTLPAGLSDEEFTAQASSICRSFAEDLEAAASWADRGSVYRSGATAMRELDFAEESAPGAAALVTYLEEAGEAWDEFKTAYEAAIATIDGPVVESFLTDAGTVWAGSSAMDAQQIDMDPALGLRLNGAVAAAAEAAGSLGLTACVP